MARNHNGRDISALLRAAEAWIGHSIAEDKSVFFPERSLWTPPNVDEVFHSFVDHPDEGGDDFITKLRKQMSPASASARQLTAEMLWILLLFPSNVRPETKRTQITDIWAMSGQSLAPSHPLLRDEVLMGIGSGGPAFGAYRPDELEYLIALVRDIKLSSAGQRRSIFADYEAFITWLESVPRNGDRQFRHMLRYFSFPDRVERISSNNDRRRILKAFEVGGQREVDSWTDRQLDDELLGLRKHLESQNPGVVLDFYDPPLKQRWTADRTIKTPEGEVSVSVPSNEEEIEESNQIAIGAAIPGARQSIQVQAKLARIGAVMGFKVWIPRNDRGRVAELLTAVERTAFLQDLPLNYDDTTIATIEQIDVLWLKNRSIARAFEVEHTTAVYSGLLRMADLLALQPNINIRLHIVAPEERREKVFQEIKRPVFSLLDRGPLSRSCTFISYEGVEAINGLEHLAYTNEGILARYEKNAE